MMLRFLSKALAATSTEPRPGVASSLTTGNQGSRIDCGGVPWGNFRARTDSIDAGALQRFWSSRNRSRCNGGPGGLSTPAVMVATRGAGHPSTGAGNEGPGREVSALHQIEARYRAVVEDQTELICRYRADGT